MELISKTKMLCICCMEEHDVQTVLVQEQNIFKDTPVKYDAKYFYCDKADEYYADESMVSENDISMKDAYRETKGLLTSKEIVKIRAQYDISQNDLCLLLGWGKKTITRYESHQVQDIAHDTILKKLANDPEWFLSLLESSKSSLPEESYTKYLKAATLLYEKDHDLYLRKAISARYANFHNNSAYSGNTRLSINTVIDVIHYFANSPLVTNLYKVKLMKLLWYADALSYKRRAHTITGLVYQALPMGAVPVAHDFIINLSDIEYEEVRIGEGVGYRFKESANKVYPYLTSEDIGVLDDVIRIFGKMSTDQIISSMHKEKAYTETALKDIIQFNLTENLSIS